MRKSFKWFLTASLAALAVIGCAKQGDLDKMAERMDGIENRVSALEDAVKNLNETEVPNLVSLVRSLQGNITVKSVVETEDGYTITFSDGTIATLKNGVDGKDGINAKDGVGVASIEENEAGYLITFTDGKTIQVNHGQDGLDGKQVGVTVVDGVYVWTVDGEVLKDEDGNPIPVTGADGADGDTPKVSITLIEGEYYWTVNGAVLKDDAGNPIPVAGKDGKDGVTPQFGILDGHWVVSYDNGDTWKTLGLTSDTDYSAYIDPDKETDDYIVLVVGATEVQIPKEKAFTLTFTTIENNGLLAGETAKFPYVISGVNASDETDVDIIGIVGDWTAEVVATDNASGYLTVTATENMTAKVTVYAANHKGKTDIRTLKFEEGVLEAIIETRDIDWEGGELDLAVKTNRAYHIFIPAAAEDWITVTPETKVRTDNYTISVAKNESGAYRTATLQVLNQQGKSVKDIEILQYANPDAPTDLASVMEVPDEKDVYVNGVTVVAASKASTIVTDGEAFSYITNFIGTPGTVISVTGVKNTDALGLGYVVASDVKMDTEAEPVEVDTKANYLYYGVGASGYNYYYTAANGFLAAEDGVYTVAGLAEPQQFVIEDPTQDLSALAGKLVTFSGWVKTVDYEEEVKEDIHIVLTDIKAVTLTQEAGWKPYYGGAESGDAGYPEVVGNEVSNPQVDVFYALNVVHAADVEAFGSLDNLLLYGIVNASDNTLFYLWMYMQQYGFDYDKAFSHLAYSESEYETWREFEEGTHFVIAAGVDAEGRLTGKYAIAPFEKVSAYTKAAYEDFLGKWTYTSDGGTQTWEFTEKEKGKTYTVTGIAGISPAGGVDPVAEYDAETGTFTLSRQKLGSFNYQDNYQEIPIQDVLTSIFFVNGEFYDNVSYMLDPLICTGKLAKDKNSVSVIPSSDDFGPFEGMSIIGDAGDDRFLTYGATAYATFPGTLSKASSEPDPGYTKWLGKWNVTRQEIKFSNGAFVPVGDPVEDTWTIAEKAVNSTFVITGMYDRDFPVMAKYDAKTGSFTVSTQENLGQIQFQGDDYACSVAFHGVADLANYGGRYTISGSYPIFQASLTSDDAATLTPGTVTIQGMGSFVLTGARFVALDPKDKQYYSFGSNAVVNLPNTMKRAASGASVQYDHSVQYKVTANRMVSAADPRFEMHATVATRAAKPASAASVNRSAKKALKK